MQLTKGAIGNLINRYKAVLKKCHLMNTFGSLAVAGMLVMGGAGMAVAEGSWTKSNGETAQWTNGVVPNGTVLQGTYKGFSQAEGTLAGVATVDYTTTGVSVANGTTFTSNSKTAGAAGALKLLNGITIGDNVKFENNKAESPAWGGGALYIKLVKPSSSTTQATPSAVQEVTIGAKAVFTGNEASSLGGAIALEYGRLTIKEGALFKDNKAATGGAIAMWHDANTNGDTSQSLLSISNANFISNTASSAGGALFLADKAGGKVTITDSQFDQNSSDSMGGAIYNAGTLTFTGTNSFTSNTAQQYGGAIFTDGILSVKNTTFDNNIAGVVGGAIASTTTQTASMTISGSTFTNNHSVYDGGAIGNYSGMIITNSTFENNTAQLNMAEDGTWTESVEDSTAVGGGAISLGAVSSSAVASISNTTFKNNISGTHGGAIATRMGKDANNSAAKLDIAATFIGNKAQQGGAIYNTFYTNNGLGKGDGVTVAGDFQQNTASDKGGAIFNDGARDKSGANGGIMTVSNSNFDGNTAKAGGAIYNTGTLTVGNSTFTGNSATENGGAIYNAGTLTFTGTNSFTSNTAQQYGGAIFTDGILSVKNTTFDNNIAGVVGGAIASTTTQTASMTISGSTFTNNHSVYDGGAIGNYSGMIITNSTFENNTAQLNMAEDGTWTESVEDSTAVGGGAISLGAVSSSAVASISNTTFKNNISGTHGGAIATRMGKDANNSAAKLDIAATFIGNKAQQGGAIYNTFYTNNGLGKGDGVTVAGDFQQNTASDKGGAIFNDGARDKSGANGGIMTVSNSNFDGNTAKAGGAIYNTGTNTFTNNTAAGKANDIYNAGTITVNAGTTTLNSGLILAAGSQTDVSGGALVINGTTTWEAKEGTTLGSLNVTTDGALTLQKDDVLVGNADQLSVKDGIKLSVTDGSSLYLINNSNYTATDFTAAKNTLTEQGALNTNASFGFVGGTLVSAEDNKATDLVVSGNTINSTTEFTEGLAGTEVHNNSFLKNDLKVEAGTNDEVTINSADVAVNKVNIETSATGEKLAIDSGSLTVVGGNANDKLIAANGTDDLTTITVDSGKLNLGSAAMPDRGAGTLGAAEIALGSNGSLNASNGDYTVGDVTGTGKVTADAGANLNTGGIEALAVTADAANIKATGDVTAGDIDLVKGGSVTSDKNITVNGSIEDADGTLQAGGNITVQNDITKAGNGKLTVAAGGTIEAANISATNVAAKKLTASGDVAVDGGVLNLTGTGTATADASTVDSLTLTNGTQADIAGSLQLATNSTLTVGTDDDTVGGTTLSAQHIDLNGGMLLVDPAWGLASSNVAVESLSAGSVGVGRNSYLALGTADTGWLPGVVGNYTKGVGLSETGITAALGVFKGIEIAAGKNLTVDGSKTGTEINTGWTSSGATNSATFADNSLLVINGQNIYGDKAAISFKNPGTLSVAEGAKLLVTDAVAGQTYTIVGNVTNPATNLAGWKNNGMTSTTDMISLGDAKFDGTDKVTTSAVRNDAHTVFPNLSDGMANAVNDLYTGHAGAAGQPNWDYADVNSDQMGVRFLSRATDNRFLGMDKNAAAESIESAARIAFAGAAPQMTRMASDAGTNAVVNRLGFADPADGAQAMDAEGKIVDRNTTGFALWIAPLWQSQHGWGLDAGNMDYGFNGNLGGVSLGADYTFENAIRAGITFNIGGGYAESSGGDLSSTENRMNFWGLGAYAGWNYENFGVMADVSYTSTWNQLKQDLDSRLGMGNKLEADVQASAISAGLRAEYLLQTSAMDIIPHIGVRYMSLNTWGYDVDTHGGTVLEGDSLHQDIWTFPIGVTFTKDFALDSGWSFKPSLDFTVIPAAGDIKAKHDVHFTGLPGTYEVETQMMDYLTWQGGVGLELANDNMSIGVNYTLQAGQHTTGHGVFGSFRYEF